MPFKDEGFGGKGIFIVPNAGSRTLNLEREFFNGN